MKGGPSVEVLLDLALGEDAAITEQAAEVLKSQVFLYDADTDRLKAAYEAGSAVAKDILESYAKAEFFTKLPEVDEEIEVVTYVAAEETFRPTYCRPATRRTRVPTANCTANA